MVKNTQIKFTTISPKVPHAGLRVQFVGDERNLGKLASYGGLSPEEKIINAFLRQGEEIFRELEHDFLLVLHTTDCTYLVRDRFGVQSLYFKSTGDLLQYSSDLRDLRQDEAVASEQVWAYFHPSTRVEPKVSSATFFQGIRQVPPAHYYYRYVDGREGFSSFYAPQPDFTVEEPLQAFRERLYASVLRCSQGVTGSHLSGGLDSSAVTLMLKEQGLDAFSTFYFDIGDTCQRDPYYAHLVSEKVQSHHHYVLPNLMSVFDELMARSAQCGFPEMFVIPSSVHAEIARTARGLGVDTLLTGMDGDAVVGHGYNYLTQLREKSDWELLVEEIANIRMKRLGAGAPYAINLKRQVVAEELKGLLKQKSLRRFRTLFALARKRWGYTPLRFIAYLAAGWGGRSSHSSLLKMKPVPTEEEELGVLYAYEDREIVDNFRAVVNADYPYYFEEFRRIGKAEGVHFAHPFFDQRLFELCLSVPDRVRFGGGETRSLMRQAMEDLFPKELLQRHDKDEFSPFLYRSCVHLWDTHQDFFHAHSTLWEWVDLRTFLKQMHHLRTLSPYDPRSRMLSRNLSKVLYFGCWLASN